MEQRSVSGEKKETQKTTNPMMPKRWHSFQRVFSLTGDTEHDTDQLITGAPVLCLNYHRGNGTE